MPHLYETPTYAPLSLNLAHKTHTTFSGYSLPTVIAHAKTQNEELHNASSQAIGRLNAGYVRAER